MSNIPSPSTSLRQVADLIVVAKMEIQNLQLDSQRDTVEVVDVVSRGIAQVGASITMIRERLESQSQPLSQRMARDFNILVHNYDSLRGRFAGGGAFVPTPSLAPRVVALPAITSLPSMTHSLDELLNIKRKEARDRFDRPAPRDATPTSSLGHVPVLVAPSPLASSSLTPTLTPIASRAPAPSSIPGLSPAIIENLERTGIHPLLNKASIMLSPIEGRTEMQLVDDNGNVVNLRKDPRGNLVDDRGNLINGKRHKGYLVNVPGTVMTESVPESDKVHSGNFTSCLTTFCKSRGTILPVIEMNAYVEPTYTTRIPLDPAKMIFVIDKEGGLCAQLAVKELRAMGFSSVQDPHGALNSVDPVVLPSADVQKSVLSISGVAKSDASHVMAVKASGCPRFLSFNRCVHEGISPHSRRYEEDPAAFERLSLLKKDVKKGPFGSEVFLYLNAQRIRMNHLLWDKILDEGAQIITFDGGLHPTLVRDTERFKIRTAKGLENRPRIIIPITSGLMLGERALTPQAQTDWNNNFCAGIRQLFVRTPVGRSG